MKYLTLLILVCLISCNDDKPKPINNDEKELILETSTEIVETYDLVKLSAYQQFLQKMDKTILRSNLDAMMEFKKLTATSNPMTVDSAYLHYRTFYQAFQIKQHADLEKDTSDFCYLIYGSDEEIDAQYLLRLKTKIKKFQNNGINVECSEGAPFVTEYRPFIKQHFLPKLSETMQLFVAQEMKENEDYLYEDAGISIELNTVIDRIVWHENFEKKYPDFILKRSSIDLRVWHQTAILKGSDNSSIEQYREEGSTEKIQLEENFSKAFNYSLKTYPQSEISQAIVKLLKVVNSNDRKKIDALLKTFGSQKIIYDYNDENGE